MTLTAGLLVFISVLKRVTEVHGKRESTGLVRQQFPACPGITALPENQAIRTVGVTAVLSLARVPNHDFLAGQKFQKGMAGCYVNDAEIIGPIQRAKSLAGFFKQW